MDPEFHVYYGSYRHLQKDHQVGMASHKILGGSRIYKSALHANTHNQAFSWSSNQANSPPQLHVAISLNYPVCLCYLRLALFALAV